MSADKYDFIITYNSTDYKYMLRQQGNTKSFLVSDAPLTPQTLVTESASPTTLQPERQIQISQVDWRKGFQSLILDDEYKYYDSEDCDARLKGEITLSPKKLSALSWATVPSTPTITDSGLEVWTNDTDLTNWTKAGDAPYKDDSIYHGGSSSARYDQEENGTLTQEVISSGDISNYKGLRITAKVYARTTDKAHCTLKIKLDDGDTSTESNGTLSADDTWEQIEVTHRISYSGTKLDIVLEADITSLQDGWFDDVSLTLLPANASGATVDIVEFGGKIVAAVDKNLYTIGTSSTTLIADFPKNITDLCVFQNRLYIAQGWSDPYYYTSDLVAFTESTLSNNTAKYMANIGGATFVISDTNNTLRSSDNPINGGTAFSSQYEVGSDDWDITGLVDHEDTWFVRKEDNVYYLSGSDVLELIPELSSEASSTYTYGLYYWKGNLYIGSGVNSLYEYDISSGTVTTISPTRYAPGDSNYDGQVLAMCGDETYLYVAIDNGSGIKILSGRWENVDGDTDWYWHPLYTLSSHNDITAMLISSLSGNKRLYTGTDTASDGVIPYIVPVGYSQPYTESGYKCQSSGTFITPWYVSNFPTESKYWKSVDFTSICCTDKTSITPYYQIKGGSWTAMDALTTSAYDGGYPAETTDSRAIEQESEKIRFKFEMASSDNDYTPILYGKGGGGIVTYAVLQATKKRQVTATLQISPKIRLRDGTVEERTVSTDLSNLRTIYQAGGEITITAPDDTTYTCVFARDGYSEQLGYDEVMRTECWWCRLQLLEV